MAELVLVKGRFWMVENASKEPSDMKAGDDAHADFERRIRERAYLLWDGEGRPVGKDDEYWHRAREALEDEAQPSYPARQSRGRQA